MVRPRGPAAPVGPTTVVDGLIVAERQYWNMLELLAQLGMFVPMPEG
jgi:hypothetical protein